MKALFLLGRTKRSVPTLENELTEFEKKLDLSADHSIMCGDLAFWPIPYTIDHYRQRDNHPGKFWEAHAAEIESGPLTEFVIGEIGRGVLSAGETAHIDRHNDETYMYGAPDDAEGSISDSLCDHSENADYYDDDLDTFGRDPYVGRRFWTIGVQHWFNDVYALEETPSCGRKLLITIGHPAKSRFLETRVGQKLRTKLGNNNRVVLNGQGEDVAAVAFRYHASPVEIFGQLKRLLPPRLVEDFLILDIGMNYCIGEQPLNLFDQWSEQESSRECESAPAERMAEKRSFELEIVKRPKLRR